MKRKHIAEYQRIFSSQDESLSEDIIIESDGSLTADLSTIKSKQNRINVAIAKYFIITCNFNIYKQD